MNEWEDHDVTIIKYHYFCSILLGLGLEYFIDDNKDNIKNTYLLTFNSYEGLGLAKAIGWHIYCCTLN